jgi:hypothetical protein
MVPLLYIRELINIPAGPSSILLLELISRRKSKTRERKFQINNKKVENASGVNGLRSAEAINHHWASAILVFLSNRIILRASSACFWT